MPKNLAWQKWRYTFFSPWRRNFIVSTSDALTIHVRTEGLKVTKCLEEPKDAVHAITCHPSKPLMAKGSHCGLLKVWNFKLNQYLVSRIFKGDSIRSLCYNHDGMDLHSYLLGQWNVQGGLFCGAHFCVSSTSNDFRLSMANELPLKQWIALSAATRKLLALLIKVPGDLCWTESPSEQRLGGLGKGNRILYCPYTEVIFDKQILLRNLGTTVFHAGSLLAAGFTDGSVDILDSISLEDDCAEPFHDSRAAVIHMSFSHNSQFFATAVSIFLFILSLSQKSWVPAMLHTSAFPFHSLHDPGTILTWR